MRRQLILKPLVWVCLFFFLFSEMPAKGRRSEFYLAPPTALIQKPFIIIKPPQEKNLFLAAGLVFTLFFGPAFFPSAFNPSAILAQEESLDDQAVEASSKQIIQQMQPVYALWDDPGLTENQKSQVIEEKNKEIIEAVKKLLSLTQSKPTRAIAPLLEILKEASFKYGSLNTVLDFLLDEILKLIQSHQGETIDRFVVNMKWRAKGETQYQKVVLVEFLNIRVKEIPFKLFQEMVRRLVKEANAKANFHHEPRQFLDPGLAAQAVRLYLLACERGVASFDEELFKEYVNKAQIVVNRYSKDKKYYGRTELIYALTQAFAQVPLDAKNRAALFSLLLQLELFSKKNQWPADPKPYFTQTKKQLRERLLATMNLNPDAFTPTPEKITETETKVTEAPTQGPSLWLWFFLSVTSIAAGLGGYCFFVKKGKTKPVSQKSKPKKRVPVDTVTAETVRFSDEEVASFEKQVGPFVLGNVIEKTAQGVVREATVTKKNQTKKIRIREIGNLLIPVSSQEKASLNQPQIAFEINEQTQKIEKKSLQEVGDLLIETEPNDQLESIAPILGKAHRAFSISENKWLPVTPFEVNQNELYWLTEKLGQGGMGEVYKAWDPSTERYVAIKISLSNDEQDKKRFEEEAKAAASVSHKNVVATYRTGWSRVSFLIMELLHGVSLKELREKEELTWEKIVEIGIQATEGLKQIHQKDILHRDLKPANLFFVEKENRIVLTDFGLAKRGEGKGLTQSGETLGTPAYMPPEQVTGGGVTVTSDLYSMGAILYELATGEVPYDGLNLMAIFAKIISKTDQAKRKPISQFRNTLLKDFQDFVDKAMAYDAKDRFQTANEMQQALRQLQINVKKGKFIDVTQNLEEIKKGKIILALSAAVAALFLLMPIARSFRAPRKITEEVVIEKLITPTEWGELIKLSYDEAVAKLQEELKQFKSAQNQAVVLYYLALLKFKEAQANPQKENAVELLKSAIQDLNEALELKNLEPKTRENLEKMKKELLELKSSLELLSQQEPTPEQRQQQLKIFDLTPFDLAA